MCQGGLTAPRAGLMQGTPSLRSLRRPLPGVSEDVEIPETLLPLPPRRITVSDASLVLPGERQQRCLIGVMGVDHG